MTTSRQRRKVMARATLEEWLLDRQENGDDGTGYNDYNEGEEDE
jgi:hypothetical protein